MDLTSTPPIHLNVVHSHRGRERTSLEDLGTDERIILKWIIG
jgi:hypothetical protein